MNLLDHRTLTSGVTCLGFALVSCCAVDAQDPNQPERITEPPTETITLNSGITYKGYLQSRNNDELTFVQIVRHPGKPMGAVVRIIPAELLKSHSAISAQQREQLARQIHQLRHRLAIEANNVERLELVQLPDAKPPAWQYIGPWFQSLSGN